MTEFVPLPGTWPTATYALNVNDTTLLVDTAWLGESLLFALRERGGLTAAKDGCGQENRGECGACTLFLDGEPTVSCLVPAVAAVGRAVTTPEAYATVPPDAVARVLADRAGPGCGFCLPGIGMTLRALLARGSQPSPAAVREALSGHHCRCLGIDRFLDAVVSLTQPAGAQASAEQSLAEQSLGDSGAYEQVVRQESQDGQGPRGQAPQGQAPRGQQPRGQSPSGQPRPHQQPQPHPQRPQGPRPRPSQSQPPYYDQPEYQPPQPRSPGPQPDRAHLPGPRQAPDPDRRSPR